MVGLKQKSPSIRNENEPLEVTKHYSQKTLEERSLTPTNIKRLIDLYTRFKPEQCWSNWVVSYSTLNLYLT